MRQAELAQSSRRSRERGSAAPPSGPGVVSENRAAAASSSAGMASRFERGVTSCPVDLPQCSARGARRSLAAADEFSGATESALQTGLRAPGNAPEMSDPWRIPGLLPVKEAMMRSATHDLTISTGRANALFASALQRSDQPSPAQVHQAIAAAIRVRRPGLRGTGSAGLRRSPGDRAAADALGSRNGQRRVRRRSSADDIRPRRPAVAPSRHLPRGMSRGGAGGGAGGVTGGRQEARSA